MSRRLRPIGLAAALLALPAALTAQAGHTHDHPAGAAPVEVTVGRVEFPNSGAAAAQPAFLRGMALLHSFLYREARASFAEAQKADPGFAMAYVGEVMAAQDSAAGDSILRRMGRTPAERMAKAPTPREKAWLGIAERWARVGQTEAARSAAKYADDWRALHEAHPDDESALFYALALISLRYDAAGDADRSLRYAVQSAALAEDVFARRPDHPGAAHYLIHAYDDARLAPLGLRAASAYARIAPAAHHAVHMPSHIFFQYGRWPDVVAANEKAWRLSTHSTTGQALPSERWDYHAADWLQYAYLQQGRFRRAAALTDSVRAALAAAKLDQTPERLRAFLAARVTAMDARASMEQRRFDAAFPAPGTPLSVEWLLAARTAAARRDTATARRVALRVEQLTDSVQRANPRAPQGTSTLERQTRALARLAAGDTTGTLALLREAADTVEANPRLHLAEGPSRAESGTTRVLLGELLLESGKAEDALDAYDRALVLSPGRSVALLGRARALAKLGRADEARRAYARLLENWKDADADLPELAEARRGAAGS